MMHVAHVVAGLDALDGGPSHTLPYLWSQLVKKNISLSVHTTFDSSDKLPKNPNDYEFVCKPRAFPLSLKRSPELKMALDRTLLKADLCHNHGCWLYPNWMAGSMARKHRKPLIISPLGHLDEWSLQYHGWRKRAIQFLVEERNWKYASAFIAKSELEASHLRQIGITSKIFVIPNGIFASDYTKLVSADLFRGSFPELKSKRLLLFLSRIHPKKGIFELLEMWKKMCSRFPDWHLVVAGSTENSHGRKIQEWLKNQECQKSVSLVQSLEGEMKHSAMTAADIFILPSHSENFGQVILESLARGTPVITTRACPWKGIEDHRCGWWIENNHRSLESALDDAMKESKVNLQEMGARGREWVLREFAWEYIGERMIEVYREVLN